MLGKCELKQLITVYYQQTMSQEWCTIESDPGLFTELISDFGAKDLQVDEIFDLSQNVSDSYGLIFLFKWRQETDPREVLDPSDVPGLFFARQVNSASKSSFQHYRYLINSPVSRLGHYKCVCNPGDIVSPSKC